MAAIRLWQPHGDRARSKQCDPTGRLADNPRKRESSMGQSYDFSGRVVIVTGAGSGMGRAMAHDFAEAGADVLVNDIIAERAHATVAEITKAGGSAVPAVADISDEA